MQANESKFWLFKILNKDYSVEKNVHQTYLPQQKDHKMDNDILYPFQNEVLWLHNISHKQHGTLCLCHSVEIPAKR